MRMLYITLGILVTSTLFGCEPRTENKTQTNNIENATKLVASNHVDPAVLQRSRDRLQSSFLDGDPKDLDAFLAWLDEEVAAYKSKISTHSYATPADKLDDMFTIDQALRGFYSGNKIADFFPDDDVSKDAFTKISLRIIEQDEFNTAQLKSMLEGREWFRDDLDGEFAAHKAWLIVQHADRKPDFQKRVLPMIERQLGAPGVSKSDYAYLYDRVYANWENPEISKQRYGTQGRCVAKGVWEPYPVEDPKNLDALRAEMGLETIEKYKKRFKTICTRDER